MGEPERTTPPPTLTSSKAGWYPDPDGRVCRRYFDGAEWTQHWETLDLYRRADILNQVIVDYRAQVQSQSATSANVILGRAADSNAVVHLLLAIVTCGLWLIVWLVIAAGTQGNNAVKVYRLDVDEYGTVTWTRPGQAPASSPT